MLSGLIVSLTAIGLITPRLAYALTQGGVPVVVKDLRVVKMEKFLAKMNSPLDSEADAFVREADKNGLDYRLLASISGVESTFARNYIEGSYNAYGWGGGLIYFKSWDEGITKISSDLNTKYAGRGAKTVDQIAPIYCPPSSGSWAFKVKLFMKQIEDQAITTPAITDLKLSL